MDAICRRQRAASSSSSSSKRDRGEVELVPTDPHSLGDQKRIRGGPCRILGRAELRHRGEKVDRRVIRFKAKSGEELPQVQRNKATCESAQPDVFPVGLQQSGGVEPGK